MPVETTLSRVQYDTNGTTGPWSIPFYFLEDADILAVYADATGAETNLVLTTDYSLTGAGDESGGTMTTVSAYAAGGTLTILRDVDALQTTEFQDGDNFPASAVNRGLDRLTMIVQQLKEKVGRALLFPVSDDTSGALPSVAVRANTELRFDADGNLNFDAPASGSAADVLVRLASSAVGWGSKLVAYMLRATGSVARWVEDKLAESVSVKDFGVVGDGVADDTEAVRAALMHMSLSGGGKLTCPPDLVLGITDTIYVYNNTRFVGKGMPVIRAISAFEGAMVQFGFTTDAVDLTDTDLCHNSSIEGFEIDGDYQVTAKDWDPLNLVAAGLDSALVYVWRNSTSNKIKNCHIHSAECDLVGAEDGADFLEIVGNTIYDATTYSSATQYINLINIDGPENAVIESNNVYGLAQSGYSPASWGYALRLHATDSATVQKNKLASGWNVVLIDGRSNLVQSNRISGGSNCGLQLYENAFKCRYNSVVHNYIDANGNIGIQEQSSADVEKNNICFNTVKNAATPISFAAASLSTVLGNITYNASDVAQPVITRLGIYKGSTVDSTSNLTSGVWTPGTIDNTTNTSGTAIVGAQYSRSGDVVTFCGLVTTTISGIGPYEFRFSPPVASTFAAASDAVGTATDDSSTYGRLTALTTGSPRLCRVKGTAASSGAKEIAFSGSYLVI